MLQYLSSFIGLFLFQWGITFGKNLTIISVKKDMRADGVLYPGDVIVSINDIEVGDQDQFYNVGFRFL